MMYLLLSSMLIDLEARQKSGAMAGLFSVNLVTSQSTSHGAQVYQQPTECVFVFANGSSASVNVAIAREHVWFPHSEAISHLTRDVSSVTNSVPYTGAGKVTVANG
ncbi:hypothetical protein Goari_000686 [Gossypium aridum]|uniref:Uncharacterized protein n=1 Tax=Gossypium aridum TaxID=34290 RepID=A0A7J8YHE5_GOSAI|nr:hypothetical protein [Gossypium aridum]